MSLSKRARDTNRKYESGHQKRLKKTKYDQELKKYSGGIEKFVTHVAIASNTCANLPKTDNAAEQAPTATATCTHSLDLKALCEGEVLNQDLPQDRDAKDCGDISVAIDYCDPDKWPTNMDNQTRRLITEVGPKQLIEMDFPVDSNGRHFNICLYERKLKNMESVKRSWLVYSKSSNKVFCFCCKLFSVTKERLSALAKEGFDDWKNVHRSLSTHEISKDHMQNMQKWRELERRLFESNTINKDQERVIGKEKLHWQNVLERLVEIVHYLATHNLAFRGSVDKLHQPNNGNFLGLVELLSKFDPVLKEHVNRINAGQIHDHYLGKTIQNELIHTIAMETKDNIVQKIIRAKYYSIILDCTPDISHQEQMSVTFRGVGVPDEADKEVEIFEHFLTFIPVKKSTGAALTDYLMEYLEQNGISLHDMRGQGYDNGSNMKGAHAGVQARILRENPKAFFTPCSCHSWNLLLADMAKSSAKAISFFGIIQRIYVLFTASTQRWDIFRMNVPGLSVKPLCETRWEARIESLKPIRYQLSEVIEALSEISFKSNEPIARSEAETLSQAICAYDFIVALVFWYEMLFKINAVSKILQSRSSDIHLAFESAENTHKWLREYRDSGFNQVLVSARDLAENIGVEPVFVQKRKCKKRRHFEYEGNDEPVNDAEDNFKLTFFNVVVDTALQQLPERFKQLKKYHELFGFLSTSNGLRQENERSKKCKDLEKALSDNDSNTNGDIDGDLLADEINFISDILPSDLRNPLQILQFIYRSQLDSVCVNLTIALRVFLTIPASVAAGERSFSKLKLIKTYLRSSMGQERLDDLSLISIEREMCSRVEFYDVMSSFASKKARKVAFV